MPLNDDRAIAELLRSVKTIALLGASPRPTRPSYEVFEFLIQHGYRVLPVNPAIAGDVLLGEPVYASLADLPEPADMLDVFRSASFLPGIMEEAIQCGIKIVWTQLGVVDSAAAQRAEGAGIRVVMDRGPAIEWPRLRRAGLL
jgi:predicted CoA-binding protein